MSPVPAFTLPSPQTQTDYHVFVAAPAEIARGGLRVDEFQPSARQVAPGVPREIELHGRRAADKPDPAGDAITRAIVDLAADHLLVDTPGHDAIWVNSDDKGEHKRAYK